jgi:hypothetical protein
MNTQSLAQPLNAGDTGVKTCVVCCKIPSGLIIEAGYTVQGGQLIRLPSYKRVRLQGPNAHTLAAAAAAGAIPVSRPYFTAGITVNVDEAFFDKWVADHREGNIVKNRQIWKCKSLAEAQGQVTDDTQRKIGLEPRTPLTQSAAERDKAFGSGFTPIVPRDE